MKNNLLILTGPQGSGNHLWAKIFSSHSSVNGWRMKDYWQGHHTEPFSHWWENPNCIEDTGHLYNFTSISFPYVRNRYDTFPKYVDFIKSAKKFYNVKLCLIGRDYNIIQEQQRRVRGGFTVHHFLYEIDKVLLFKDLHFISTELLYMYKRDYVDYLSRILDFPIDTNHMIEIVDTNKKYIKHDLEPQPLDDEVKKAIIDSGPRSNIPRQFRDD